MTTTNAQFSEEIFLLPDGRKILFRPLRDSDSIRELTGLLHLSYKQLADMGQKFLATYQDDSVTEKRAKRGFCFIGLDEEKIIATITLEPPGATKGSPWYEQNFVSHFGQFAVHPEYQKSGLGGKMLDLIEKISFQQGAKELALDTSENAHHLIAYYTKRGYSFIGYVQWDLSVVNYRSVLLSKNLEGIFTAFSGEKICSEEKFPDEL